MASEIQISERMQCKFACFTFVNFNHSQTENKSKKSYAEFIYQLFIYQFVYLPVLTHFSKKTGTLAGENAYISKFLGYVTLISICFEYT